MAAIGGLGVVVFAALLTFLASPRAVEAGWPWKTKRQHSACGHPGCAGNHCNEPDGWAGQWYWMRSPDQEQRVVTDANLNGIVIRPALLYGRSASLLAPLFKSASEGKVAWYGTPGGRYALIHTDDLSDLYVRASEKAVIAGGKIFDAANDITESVDDVLEKLVEVSGARV